MTLKCDTCGVDVELGTDPQWTEEDAAAEFAINFPGETMTDLVAVCDDCYAEILARAGKTCVQDAN